MCFVPGPGRLNGQAVSERTFPSAMIIAPSPRAGPLPSPRKQAARTINTRTIRERGTHAGDFRAASNL